MWIRYVYADENFCRLAAPGSRGWWSRFTAFPKHDRISRAKNPVRFDFGFALNKSARDEQEEVLDSYMSRLMYVSRLPEPVEDTHPLTKVILGANLRHFDSALFDEFILDPDSFSFLFNGSLALGFFSSRRPPRRSAARSTPTSTGSTRLHTERQAQAYLTGAAAR